MQGLSSFESVSASTTKVRIQCLLIDASIKFRSRLVLVCDELKHIFVQIFVRFGAFVHLKLKDVHVDVRPNQVVLTFLHCLALQSLLLCVSTHLNESSMHAAHVLNTEVSQRSNILEDDSSDVHR